MRQEYKTEVNWNQIEMVPLETEVFETQTRYDAITRLVTLTTPDGSVQANQYNQAGLLQRTEVTFAGQTQPQPFVTHIEYNANGQRDSINYGNGVKTTYGYEATTDRLLKIISKRPDGTKLQNLHYTYDPVGNVTRLRDYTYQTVFCHQQQVDPLSDYGYNALYQLIKANGRQHPGLQQHTYQNSFEPIMPPCPTNDGQKLENYTQTYQYDNGGNLVELNHQARISWKQLLPVAPNSNRLLNKPYDTNGNMLELDNLPAIHWDYRNNLSQADVILRSGNSSDSEYYVYDSGGNRVRKVSERVKNGGNLTEIAEKIYLGGFEIKRIKQETVTGSQTILDRHSLRVMDDETSIAQVYHWRLDQLGREMDHEGEWKTCYQLGNLLGSVTVEVDQEAKLISYEEYLPYGGTSLIAGTNQKEVKLKEYRYSGKEKDDDTGLYYYGVRYYASWMVRWMNPDPALTVDGLNLFGFVQNNPVNMVDGRGMCGSFKPSFKETKAMEAVGRLKAPAPQNQLENGRLSKILKNDNPILEHSERDYEERYARGMLARFRFEKEIPTRLGMIAEREYNTLAKRGEANRNVATMAYRSKNGRLRVRMAVSGWDQTPWSKTSQALGVEAEKSSYLFKNRNNEAYATETKQKFLTQYTGMYTNREWVNLRNNDSEVHLAAHLRRNKIEIKPNSVVSIYSTPNDFCLSCGGGSIKNSPAEHYFNAGDRSCDSIRS